MQISSLMRNHPGNEMNPLLSVIQRSKFQSLCIIRHGQTDWNRTGRFNSRTDLPLTKRGIKECQDLRSSLPHTRGQIIYASPMQRCVQSAAALFPQSKIITNTDLVEMDFGDFEGRRPNDIVNESDADAFHAWRSGALPSGMSNVEPVDHVVRRIVHFFSTQTVSMAHLTLVTHGVFARITACLLINIYPENYRNLKINNASFAYFEVEGDQVRLAKLN